MPILPQTSSSFSALFEDAPAKNGRSSIKTALFVDETPEIASPSIKKAIFVDGAGETEVYGSARRQRERRSASEAESTPSERRPSTVQASRGMDLR